MSTGQGLNWPAMRCCKRSQPEATPCMLPRPCEHEHASAAAPLASQQSSQVLQRWESAVGSPACGNAACTGSGSRAQQPSTAVLRLCTRCLGHDRTRLAGRQASRSACHPLPCPAMPRAALRTSQRVVVKGAAVVVGGGVGWGGQNISRGEGCGRTTGGQADRQAAGKHASWQGGGHGRAVGGHIQAAAGMLSRASRPTGRSTHRFCSFGKAPACPQPSGSGPARAGGGPSDT